MPEGELQFSDVSEAAAQLRKLLGVGPYEKVEVVTPQFERVDNQTPSRAPGSATAFDEMKKLPHKELIRIGVGVWDGGDGWKHYVFPGEWYDYIPEGYTVTDICGDDEPFVHGATDDDIRCGMLPYGWIRGEKPDGVPI